MNATFQELVAMAQQDAAAFRNVPLGVCLEATRTYMRSRWDEIRDRHRNGGSGGNVVRMLADAADSIVRGATVFARHFTHGDRSLLSRLAICALGGYGRGEMCPYSDLDVGVIYDGRLSKDIKELNRFLMPFLWDVGFHVGSTLHSVSEAMNLARQDPEVFTTYCQARLITGDNTIFARLKLRISELLTRHGGPTLEHVRRREDPANLPENCRDLYSPEPNVKENVGGLRDYHAAMWMVLLSRGATTLDDMTGLGLISPEEQLDLLEGLDFMFRVRSELHFLAGKEQDELTFDLQRQVAAHFDYGEDHQGGIERFMQDYYAAARRLRRFLQVAARICDHQIEMEFLQAPEPDPSGIVVRDGTLYAGLGDPNWFAEHPSRLMRVFWESARRNVPLSTHTERMVAKSLGLVGDAMQGNDLVQRFFVAICNRPLGAGRVLRQMANSGLLGAYMPEFAAVQNVVRYEDFHHYPVGEHTLRAIEALADIPNMESNVARVLERALQHLSDPYILVVAILLHDLGKASGEVHVEEGARLARHICARMGLTDEIGEQITFLVQHHLDMTHMSFYRDTDDAEVIQRFAETMKSDDRLAKLLLLSYADLSAVGPSVWNEWKGALLLKLFLKTERVLLGRAEVIEEEFWKLPKADAVRAEAPPRLRPKVEEHLRALGERYFIGFSPKHIARHMICLDEARETGFAVHFTTYEDMGMTEAVVCTQDRHGLFSRIAGSFASQLADVWAAALFTLADGMVVDCFSVFDAARRQPLTAAQCEGVRKVLHGVLVNGEDVGKHVEASRRRLFALLQSRAPMRTSVSFDNQASRTDTVIDIETGDRTGLLYDITRALAGVGVDIQSARIVTDARRVRDAFYVRLHNKKLEETESQSVVRDALIDAIEQRTPAETQGERI